MKILNLRAQIDQIPEQPRRGQARLRSHLKRARHRMERRASRILAQEIRRVRHEETTLIPAEEIRIIE